MWQLYCPITSHDAPLLFENTAATIFGWTVPCQSWTLSSSWKSDQVRVLCGDMIYGKTFYCTPPAKCPQMAIHYSQTLVDYFDLSQKAAAGFIMPTSSSFLLNPTFILRWGRRLFRACRSPFWRCVQCLMGASHWPNGTTARPGLCPDGKGSVL